MLEMAWTVALAQVLPRLQWQGRAAAERAATTLAIAAVPGSVVDRHELARLLLDADALSLALSSGAAADAQEHGAKLAREALDALDPGRLSAATAVSAVAAAGAVARLRRLAEALGEPGTAEVTARADALRQEPVAMSEEIGARARSAALVRASAAALEDLLPQLEPVAEALAARLRDRPAPPPEDPAARAALRRRLGRARRRREQAAARLTGRLLELARPVDPHSAGEDGLALIPRPWPTDPALLDWLRNHSHPGLYTPEVEQQVARWLATDPYRLRALPPAPPFLAGFDVTALAPEHVAPFLRRISLTRRPPTAAELTPEALERERGPVSTAHRTPELRRWGQPEGSGAPLLPEETGLPHIVHGVWVGKPMPESSVFWRNYAEGAQRYAGRVDFVYWTDIPRARFADALAAPKPPRGRKDPLAHERRLTAWAEENRIAIVSIHEVFNAEAPLRLHPQSVLELAKQLPRGYASFSDSLRVEILERFGGAYVDGDIAFVRREFTDPGDTVGEILPDGMPETLPEFFDRIAGSLHGFTVNPRVGGVDNDAIVAPAGHPAIRLWTELGRLNYTRTHPELFGGLREMAGRWAGTTARYLAPPRTGCVQYQVVGFLGIPFLGLPACRPALRIGHELSWTPPRAGEPAPRIARTEDEVVAVLARLVTYLRWQLLTRQGDLYLCGVDPVIRGLPDPDAAWTALIRAVAALGDGLPAVTSVTDARRNDDGGAERVDLPPEAQALLDRNPPAGPWIGAPLSGNGRPLMLLDELVVPARLRVHGPAADRLDVLAPFTEVAFDPCGHPVGLWFRAPERAETWRSVDRFGAVPPDHLGLSFGCDPSEDDVLEVQVRPEDIARLVLELHMAGRPVRLTVPPGTVERRRDFARRLERLLGSPVTVGGPSFPGFTPRRPPVPGLVHHPLADLRRVHRTG